MICRIRLMGKGEERCYGIEFRAAEPEAGFVS